MHGSIASRIRKLFRPPEESRVAQRFDADGWERESRTRQPYRGPEPFRGLTVPDRVFGWRREP